MSELLDQKLVHEDFLTTKELISDSEYILTQTFPHGELVLRNGNQVIQKFFTGLNHFRELLKVAPTPADLVQWMRKNMKVSFYEPLSQWAISINQLEKPDTPQSFKAEDWKAEPYGMSFNLVATSGQDMGLASIEFMPPFIKTITQSVELCDMDLGAAQPTSIEKKCEVMF